MKSYRILDGGMGREIKLRLASFDPILWSASALIDDPQMVVDLHKEFIDAGADIITTNNYTVVPYVLEQKKLLNNLEILTAQAGELAQKAAVDAVKDVKVAGCLPPLQTTYRPDLLEKDINKAVAVYQKIIHSLDPYVDFFLAESLTSIQELQYVIKALEGNTKPLYASFIVDDQNPDALLGGMLISEAVSKLNGIKLAAVLFNCCQAKTISHAFKSLANLDHAFGAYPNAFKPIQETWEHGNLREVDETASVENYLEHVHEWIKEGATIIGGCCGIGPEYIKALNQSLKSH